MAEIRKGLIVTNSTQQIKTFTDDISSNVNLNLGSGYNTAGNTSYPIQFSHLTSEDGEQKAVTINNGLVGIDTTTPKSKLHIGKEYFGKNTILGDSKPASVINEHTSQTSDENHNYYKIAQISVPSGATCCYGGLNIKGTIIGQEDLNPSTSGFDNNFMHFDITIMVNHAVTTSGSPNLYMIGTVNGSAMNNKYVPGDNSADPTLPETDIIVSKLSDTSNYPMGVLLCVHKNSVCNIEITSTAYNHSDINCFTIDYDGVRKPTNILLAYSTWQSDCLLQLSDPTKNDIIYNTPHGVGINQNNPFTTFAVKGNMVIGSGTGYNVGDQQQSVLTGSNELTSTVEDNNSTATFANGLLVEGNVGIGTNKLYTNTKLHIKDTTEDGSAFNLTLQNNDTATTKDNLNEQETNIRFHNYKNATIAMIQARKHGIDGAASGTTDTSNSNADLAFLTNNNTGHTNTPDQKMIIKYDGKVGIGTADPKSKLDIEGNVAIGSTYSGSTAAPSNGMIVEGNVGIGTTTPKSGLDINSNLTVGNTYAGNNAAPTDGMIVEGNVGIGTSAPKGKLQVFGDKGLTISGNNDSSDHRTAVLRFGSPYLEDNDAYCAKITSFNNQGGNYASDLRFYTHDGETTTTAPNPGVAAAKERMSILSNGNVGIGTTTPSATLHINRPNGTTGVVDNKPLPALEVYKNFNGVTDKYAARIYGTDTSIGETGIRICEKDSTSLTSNGTKVLDVYSNDLSKMVVTGAGNVGIGTTTPQSKLDVEGSVRIGSTYSGDNSITTDPTNGMIVEGNVGIGTNDPGKKLEVSNDALISTLTVGRGNNEVEENTAFGFKALYVNTDGTNNTALGYKALLSNTDGTNNTALGYQALDSTGAGSGNTGIGKNAGTDNGTGNNNTYLGFLANCNFGNSSNSTAIGYNALITKSDQIVLGSTGSTTTPIHSSPEVYIPGNVGIGTTVPEGLLHISSTGDAILKITGDSGNTDYGSDPWTHPYLIFQQDAGYNMAGIFLGTGDSNTGDGSENDLIISACDTNGGNIHFKTNASSASQNNTISSLKNATTNMTIANDGNVGIGTTNPSTTLDISGSLYLSGNDSYLSPSSAWGDGTSGIQTGTGNSNGTSFPQTYIGFGAAGAGSDACYLRQIGGDNNYILSFDFRDDPGDGRLYMRALTGSVSTNLFTMINGAVTATSFDALSDIRLKENIVPLENCLSKISQLSGYNYNLIRDKDKKLSSGLLAQHVEKIIPEVVNTSEDKNEHDFNEKSIRYEGFTPYLIEAIKELKKENDELKEDIKRKGDVIVKLHNDVSSIKEMLKIRN